jgi:serine phosphatase RsbU (regulator of sigma subunit)/anti-sigma regulatory factor (Ser/Thr protein kinase)
MEENTAKILIVDDDPGVRESFREVFAAPPSRRLLNKLALLFSETEPAEKATPPETGYELTFAENGFQGVDAVKSSVAAESPFIVSFVDMKMPGIDGAETAKRIWSIDPRIKIVIVTAFSTHTPDEIVENTEREDIFYLRKPFNPEEIRQFARALTRQWKMEREKDRLSESLNLAYRQLKNYAEDLNKTHKELASARDQEIATASEIQRTLLMATPPENLPGIEIASLTIASEAVDGDFYDYFKIIPGCLDIVVGDVMGKGVPAALLGAATKNYFLRTINRLFFEETAETAPQPAEIISGVQQSMREWLEKLGAFVTLCYARFNLSDLRLDYVDCGHVRTIHWNSVSSTFQFLQGENMPIGFPETYPYMQITVPLNIGDLFLFYSDGLTEAKDKENRMFGEERLGEFVQKNRQLNPETLIDQLRETIAVFCESETFQDDFTCVAVRIGRAAGPDRVIIKKLRVQSVLGKLAEIRDFIQSFCEDAAPGRLNEKSVDRMMLAVNEIAVNIIKHAYGEMADQWIDIEANRLENKIIFRLYDRGIDFEPSKVPAPVFDGSKEGGFGLFIVKETADQFEHFKCSDGRNCTSLTFKLPPESKKTQSDRILTED